MNNPSDWINCAASKEKDDKMATQNRNFRGRIINHNEMLAGY